MNNIFYIFKEWKNSSSAQVLLVYNFLLLLSFILFKYDFGKIMLLYWLENIAIGVYTFLKMFLSKSGKALSIFFVMHYGIFCFVHLVFVLVIMGMTNNVNELFSYSYWSPVIIFVIMIFLSHGYSFYINYLKNKEYIAADASNIMMRSYGRIVVLHLTIIFGFFLVMFFGNPLVFGVILMILKTIVDLGAHLREHSISKS